jgi:hypothetical protein
MLLRAVDLVEIGGCDHDKFIPIGGRMNVQDTTVLVQGAAAIYRGILNESSGLGSERTSEGP